MRFSVLDRGVFTEYQTKLSHYFEVFSGRVIEKKISEEREKKGTIKSQSPHQNRYINPHSQNPKKGQPNPY